MVQVKVVVRVTSTCITIPKTMIINDKTPISIFIGPQQLMLCLGPTFANVSKLFTFGYLPLREVFNTMSVTDWFTRNNPCKRYSSNQALFEGLQAQDERAILCLQTKAMPMVMKQVRGFGLGKSQGDEILNRATLIFLQKIADGSYVFQGHAPTSYLTEVAKRLAMAASRKENKHAHQELEEQHVDHMADFAENENPLPQIWSANYWDASTRPAPKSLNCTISTATATTK